MDPSFTQSPPPVLSLFFTIKHAIPRNSVISLITGVQNVAYTKNEVKSVTHTTIVVLRINVCRDGDRPNHLDMFASNVSRDTDPDPDGERRADDMCSDHPPGLVCELQSHAQRKWLKVAK